MITADRAKELVKKKLPGYVVEWCIPYKQAFVVMAHPDNGPEDHEHGAYPDPFYRINKLTGSISPFVPAFEKDRGELFFDAVEQALRKH